MKLPPFGVGVYASALVLAALVGCSKSVEPTARSLTEFEDRLESLRAANRIAGISAAITSTDRIAWTKGFGMADIGAGRSTTDTTAYHLASLTKPFAAAILLQLVQEGKLSLDEPVATFGVVLPGSGVVRVRHLLSHTSSGTPGTVYRYDGNRFGLLDSVIHHASGKRFADAIQERIIEVLSLEHTAPNPQAQASFAVSGHDRVTFDRNLARGYTPTGSGFSETAYPSYFGTAAGLTSSVIDVARFSLALDADVLLTPATKALAFAPTLNAAGGTLPYGLGWFVTGYRGIRVVWHYGLWTANSSLIIKVPERGLTFVLLANTDGLSAPYPLGQGKIESSPWARAFLDAFVFGEAKLPSP